MSSCLCQSLEYAALNLDLRRPSTASRYLRLAVRTICRLKEQGGAFPSECRPWLHRSLHALKNADYIRAAEWLGEALDRMPPSEGSGPLMGALRRLQACLLQSGLSDAANSLRTLSELFQERRSRLASLGPEAG